MKKQHLFFIDCEQKENRDVIFTNEMLEWPLLEIPRISTAKCNEKITKIYRTVFEALAMRNPFTVRMSISVDMERKTLALNDFNRLFWFIDDKEVFSLYKHSKTENRYESIFSWFEEDPNFEISDHEQVEVLQEKLLQWTVTDWRAFFQRRLIAYSEVLSGEAAISLLKYEKKFNASCALAANACVLSFS